MNIYKADKLSFDLEATEAFKSFSYWRHGTTLVACLVKYELSTGANQILSLTREFSELPPFVEIMVRLTRAETS